MGKENRVAGKPRGAGKRQSSRAYKHCFKRALASTTETLAKT